MKSEATRNAPAFTLIEMLAVTLCIVLVAALLLPGLGKRRQASLRLQCVNNLKEIGTAYRLWLSDQGDKTPALMDMAGGGWANLVSNANQGTMCWTNYRLMSNELGLETKFVVCPSDERYPAANFQDDFKDNTHLSYFVGVSAYYVFPQSIQGGDRNLGDSAKPGLDYGFSPESGKGNDVAVPTNSTSVAWTLKMHSAGNPAGAGNILLGDGSAQQTSSDSFRKYWLTHAEPTGNWPPGHAPPVPSIRLVFP